MKKLFSEQQIKDWKSFERVRAGGRYNMFDPRARQATGMGSDKYSFVMKNYSELKTQAEQGGGVLA